MYLTYLAAKRGSLQVYLISGKLRCIGEGDLRFYGGTVGCAGCGQVPTPLIGADLLPSAGNDTWLDGNG